ncbi:MAG: response regulator transcription factor, partial [Spirochaetales bacterium]
TRCRTKESPKIKLLAHNDFPLCIFFNTCYHNRNMKTVYIVEDDESIGELIAYALQGAGFNPLLFNEATQLYKALQNLDADTAVPALFLLDIMLPHEDGLTILKKLKSMTKWQDTPVILLTAKTGEMDKVKGLDNGADDYITKPFSVLELISRIKALLRRTEKNEKKQLQFKNICIDSEKHIVLCNEKQVDLTLKEFELLRFFVENAEIVLSREKIINTVWHYDYGSETRTVDAHIKSLRQKLGTAGDCIQTVRGIGYKITEQ